MSKLILVTLLLGNMKVTAYRSVPEQTDESPWITSIGERVSVRGCAVSRDLLANGKVRYGDLLYIQGPNEFRFVTDCMHQRFSNSIDLWVATEAQEHEFFKLWGTRKLKVYLVRRK